MANVNLINDIVLPDAMVEFRNNTVITNALKPHYDSTYEAFGANPGATINFRTHDEATVRTDSLVMDVKDVEQKSVPLIRSKIFGIDMAYSDVELTQDVDGFMTNRIKPRMAVLAAKVDQYVYQTISQGIAQAVTLPVTNIDSDDILNAGVALDNASVPRDGQRMVILNPKGMKQLVSSSASLFNNAQNISQQYNDGIVKVPSLGFNFGMSQNVSTHTRGTANGSYVVATAPANGATTIAVGTGSGTFTVGDVLTFVGNNAVNKLHKGSTGEAFQAVVTAASAGGTATLSISPAIYWEGPYQNISARPAVSDSITVMGSSGVAYPQGIAIHPMVGAVSFCDLENPKDSSVIEAIRRAEDGISMSIVTFWDGRTRQKYMRFDILMGAVALEPSAGCRIYTP